MHEQIEKFALQMQIELDNNEHKGTIFDWKGITDKIADLEYHKAKMLLAIRTGQKNSIKEYIADCANILLSIGNELNLYIDYPVHTGIVSELKKDIFNYVPLEDQKQGKLLENVENGIKDSGEDRTS